MDTSKNEFVNLPEDEKPGDHLIPFEIGEAFTLKGYIFEVESIDVGANRMTLKPIGKSEAFMKDKLKNLHGHGGLGT